MPDAPDKEHRRKGEKKMAKAKARKVVHMSENEERKYSNVIVPPNLEGGTTEKTPRNIAIDTGANLKCAEMLAAFFQKPEKEPQDYSDLDTFGRDAWTESTFPEMLAWFGKPTFTCISNYFYERKDQAKALRWHGRGLSLSDAIRKVIVDQAAC